MSFWKVYKTGFWLTYILAFAASWVYCIVEYGYLLGVGLGWLPSIFVAPLVAAFWPVIAIAGVFLFANS